MLDVLSVSAIVAAGGVLVGVILTVLELRNLSKARQTDLVMRLYSTFGSKEFLEDWQKVMGNEYENYNDFVNKYGSWTPQVGLFFEGLGVLLRRKLIDISLVDDLFTGGINMLWNKSKPVIMDARVQMNYPQYGEWFEYLYNEMKKRGQTLPTLQ